MYSVFNKNKGIKKLINISPQINRINNIYNFEKFLILNILMIKYNHLFFDLDRTLWDFQQNSQDTFLDIYTLFHLKEKGIPNAQMFLQVYTKHNNLLWEQYRKGLIEKSFLSIQRYILTLQDFNIKDPSLAEKMAKEYVRMSPLKTKLLPYAHETLEYLSKKYTLHIITNGFIEVQYVKISNSNLKKYFTHIITSEEAGYNKPNENIFYYAFQLTTANNRNSLMIGDDFEVDILGAQNVKMDQVYFNYQRIKQEKKATYEIHSLKELMEFL
ncbi:MAG TPA: YjjG family noncanonical pyrimidine nucleotidase [Bacteroidales bacterium]|nr:YjjG family noncanonical pyrimidine nucleotidase [Bacteroidales bacterium]